MFKQRGANRRRNDNSMDNMNKTKTKYNNPQYTTQKSNDLAKRGWNSGVSGDNQFLWQQSCVLLVQIQIQEKDVIR